MLIPQAIFDKLGLIKIEYEGHRFRQIQELSCERLYTYAHFRYLPDGEYEPIRRGDAWGDDDLTMWLRAVFTMPRSLDGQPVFVGYENTGMEALLEVDGVHMGGLDTNHHFVLIDPRAKGGKTYTIGIESYAGRSQTGVHVHEVGEGDVATFVSKNCRTFPGVFLYIENPTITRFVFDLNTLLQQYQMLDEHHFRKARLANCLKEVFRVIPALPGEVGEEVYLPRVRECIDLMQPLLSEKNGPSAATCITMGHSHLDTAWRWTLEETKRKCGRTYSTMVNLLDQYPQFTFLQSTPYHAELTRDNYPDIFQRMVEKQKEGRWEPNGAMYVEPDCNLTSGESLARQLLIGQRTTRALFGGYTADTLWLPDTFGYSAALPQLLQLAHVRYFCTTKLYWNDTNRFPFDTFYWKGLDGHCRVLTNFHKVHFHPDPLTLNSFWQATVQHKEFQNSILAPFGYGDGGGGPMHEMIEEAIRLTDLEGTPKTTFGTVTQFMEGLAAGSDEIPEYVGELYLEVHRGTLTSQAWIKKYHRQAEIALHQAEFLCSRALLDGFDYPAGRLEELWKTLLVNEFHDILPGTSIAPVNDRALRELQEVAAAAQELADQAASAMTSSAPGYTVFNTLSWDRTGLLRLPQLVGRTVRGAVNQKVTDAFGNAYLLCSGVRVPAAGAAYLEVETQPIQDLPSPFRYDGEALSTPHATIRFAPDGTISSFVDKASGRQLVKEGGRLNSFEIGEDVPTYWDNWDINYEQQLKRHPDNRLLSRRVAADGPLSLRIESTYEVGYCSKITQVMVFYADTPQIDFETVIDWHEKHMLLKALFETDIFATEVLNETQFGFLARPTTENNREQWAKFEVPQQKWSDLSDRGFGIAILNDGKYGIAARKGTLSLSLLKSGNHPDPRADEGVHTFTYALLPHSGPFAVETVTRPAYELNIPPVVVANASPKTATVPVRVQPGHVIVETVKKAEDSASLIVRAYEAGCIGGYATLTFDEKVKRVCEVDLLEEPVADVPLTDSSARVYFRPFEIKTYQLFL